MDKQKCDACGEILANDAFVCSSCGSLVRDIDEINEDTDKAIKSQFYERRRRERTPDYEHAIKKTHILFLVLGAVLTVLFVMMFMASKSRKDNLSTSSDKIAKETKTVAKARVKLEGELNAIKVVADLSEPGRDFYIVPNLATVDVKLSVATVLATGKPTLDKNGKGRISLKPISDPYAPIIADIFYKDGKPFRVLIPKNIERIKKINGAELEVISKFNYMFEQKRQQLSPEEIDELRRQITEDAGYDYDAEVGSGFWRACYESELWREEYPLSAFFGLVQKNK